MGDTAAGSVVEAGAALMVFEQPARNRIRGMMQMNTFTLLFRIFYLLIQTRAHRLSQPKFYLQ